MEYFDTYEDLMDHLEEEEEELEDDDDDDDDDWDDDDDDDDWDDDDDEDNSPPFLIGVTFGSNTHKIYNYGSTNTNLKKGDVLIIKGRHQRRIDNVLVVGYAENARERSYIKLEILDQYRPKRENKYKKKEKTTMKSAKTRKAISAAKTSLNETKDIAIRMVKGQAIITAIKTSLMEMDSVPDAVKAFLVIPGYSDLAIGFILNMAGQTFTDSEIIEDAAGAANFVGSVEFAKQFTIIQELIESTIKSAMGKGKIDWPKEKINEEKTGKGAKKE